MVYISNKNKSYHNLKILQKVADGKTNITEDEYFNILEWLMLLFLFFYRLLVRVL